MIIWGAGVAPNLWVTQVIALEKYYIIKDIIYNFKSEIAGTVNQSEISTYL